MDTCGGPDVAAYIDTVFTQQSTKKTGNPVHPFGYFVHPTQDEHV